MENKLSIIIPVYNEEKTILDVIKKIKNVSIKKEILIVDDFSRDRTREILKKIKDRNIFVFFNEKNYGKGYSIRKALKKAKGKMTIIQDADLEYNPNEYLKMISLMKDNNAKVVFGSRALNKNNPHSYWTYYIGNLFLNIITNLVYNSYITDMETCYKMIDTKLLKSLNLKSNRFDIEPEITAKILKKNIKIYEVPITYNPRKITEGKKIKWVDGIWALWTLIKYRFVD